jgi:hypothetical protein
MQRRLVVRSEGGSAYLQPSLLTRPPGGLAGLGQVPSGSSPLMHCSRSPIRRDC